ncbi:MAG: hypothetical protein K2L91_02195 [Duncaniella sp.]|nr:hypothetical protein [Duncaniella sp.]MDE6571885.1 hypothetical protein [Duncaniella sp.]
MKHTVKAGACFIAMSLLALTSCGDSTPSRKVSQRVKDHDAYSLGERHAAALIEISSDEAAVQDRLLEIHARATNIGEKIGAQSAADYERGFTRYIQNHSDSLARLLF